MNSVPEPEKVDRRVRKTRRALREAMQNLMAEKGYEQVTVEELTERADIGRTTFYLHYGAKQDLLLEQFDELLDQLVEQLSFVARPLDDGLGDEITIRGHLGQIGGRGHPAHGLICQLR